jgi:hypothetical protein
VRARVSKAKKQFSLKNNPPSAFIPFLLGETAPTLPEQ